MVSDRPGGARRLHVLILGFLTCLVLATPSVAAVGVRQPQTPPRLAFHDSHVIYQAVAGRSSVEEVTRAPAGGPLWSPTWSPDGSEVAYVTQPCAVLATGCFPLGWVVGTDVYVADVRTGDARRILSLPHMAVFGLEWSPSGRQLAFYAYKVMETGLVWGLGLTHPDVYVVDVTGSGLTPVTADGMSTQPRWSPDGRRLAYVSSRDGLRRIYASEAGLLSPATLVSRGGLDHSAHLPDWSPDGTWIAYLADTISPDHLVCCVDAGLWLARPDGSEQRDLQQAADSWGGVDWSPDSRSLAYTKRVSSHPSTAYEVHTMRLGGRSRFVMHGTTPLWAPDGQHLAVDARDTAHHSLATVNLRTGVVTPLSAGSSGDHVWTHGRPAAQTPER